MRNKTQQKGAFEWLPLAALKFDSRVQRSLVAPRVKHLAENFNIEGIGVVTVSQRADGYYVLDGQHRVEAARRAGYGDIKIKCHVYRRLTPAEEAERFLVLNDSRTVSAIDKFRIGLVAGDPTALGVEQILKGHGLHVDYKPSEDSVSCVDAITRLYKRDPALLEQVLATSLDAWGTRSASLEQLVISGLGLLFSRYNGEIDRKVLQTKLSKYKGGPGNLIGDARALSDLKPITKTRAFAEIVVDTYNQGRRAGALPPL